MVEGFKNTEVGVIPEDWEVKSLGDIAQINMGQSPDSKFYKSYKTGLPLIQGNADLKNKKQVIRFWSSQITKTCDEGEIIMTVRAPVGAIGLSTERSCIGRGVCSLKANNIEKFFLYFSLEFKESEWKALEQGSTFTAANSNQIKGFQIPLPPTKAEQTAIATALNDADALISSLEKLIAKKKAIKQGAMQELLKPKEGWETKTLGEVSKFRRGSFPQPYGLDKWYDDKNGFPFIQVYDVDYNMKLKPDTKRHISDEAKSMSVFVEKGSILLTIQGSIGRIAMTQYDAYVDRTLLLFESYKIPFNKYFFMLLVYVLFEQEKQNAPGGTIKTITKQVLANFNISYPNIEEQNRIAQILFDMDNEIEQLEAKLEKQKQLKQGMMQSLLTGKIRLV